MYPYIFISPHDDDVPFSLGEALLNHLFINGLVVTVFSISNCTIDDHDDCIERVTLVRKKEHQSFFDLIDNMKLIYLDRLDAPIRLGIEESSVCQATLYKSDGVDFEVIRNTIQDKASVDSILFAPLGLGEHIDHLLVRDAVCSLRELGFSMAFYEDLPYVVRAKYTEREKTVHYVQQLCGRVLKPIDIRIPLGLQKKSEALVLFDSQVDDITIAEIINYRRTCDNYSIERVWCCEKSFSKLIDHKYMISPN